MIAANQKRSVQLALLALLPLTGLLVLSLAGRHPPVAGSRISGPVTSGPVAAASASPSRRNKTMTNIQITIGGPAVNMSSQQLVGYAGPAGVQPPTGDFNVLASDGATLLVPNTPIPASGAGVTVGRFTFVNTGTTSALGGGTQPILSLQALSGGTAAAGSSYQINPGTGAPNYVVFDTVGAAAPVPKEQHFFSTGTLSATYTDHNTNMAATAPFGELQGIDFNLDWAAQLLSDAAQKSVFPVDVALHDGKFTVKAQHVGITADQLCFLAGLQLNVTANPVVETINAVSFPQHASMTFTGQDTAGRLLTVTLNSVYADGFSLPFKLSDWAMSDVTFHAIADQNGVIGTMRFSS